jgi:hypothetical protein
MRRAWIFALLAACGGDHRSIADARPALIDGAQLDAVTSDGAVDALAPLDAAPDAPTADAAVGTPTLLGPWGAPAVIATLPAGADDPTLTDDRLEIYFQLANDIHVARRASVSEAWGPSSVVAELSSATAIENTPEVAGDGLTIYFASTRMPTLGFADIWMATRPSRASAWDAPVRVVELSSAFGDGSATPSGDGLTIVLASLRPDSISKLFLATRATTGDAWGAPVELQTLASGVGDFAPMLSSDGLTIYFDSQLGGGGDLYQATRGSPDAAFGPAEPISELNTSAFRDSDPWVSADGRHVVFSSNRGGSNQLWEATR